MREKLWLLLLGVSLGYGFLLIRHHKSLHEQNSCAMTFMWRPIFLPRIELTTNVSSYGLFQYYEGIWNDFTADVLPNDIPVLFVPGSGGSAMQVRSVASVMMNKTMMRSAPFRMKFYAVDFQEELSFMSASTLLRQREFVITSIKKIRELYKKANYRKIILIGHSFGGVVINTLPLHPSFDVSVMDLIINQASPLSRPPILLDKEMESLYNDIDQIWKLRKESLAHIGILSYSGGVKDFQVSDSMANSDRVRHLPSWSVRGCDTAADHLCILWCNGLVRHSTRLLFDYGMEVYKKSEPRSGKVMVDEFYAKQLISIETPEEDVPEIRIFENLLVEWSYTSSIDQLSGFSTWKIPFHRSLAFSVNIRKIDSCKGELKAKLVLPDGLSMVSNSNSTINVGLQTDSGEALLTVTGPHGCEYSLLAKVDLVATFYQVSIDNAQALTHLVASLVLILFICEDFGGINIVQSSIYVIPVILGCFSFLPVDYIVQTVLAINVTLSIVVALFSATIVSFVLSKSRVHLLFNNNLVVTLPMLLLAVLNAHLGCAYLSLALLLRRLHNSSALFFLISAITSAVHVFLAINGPGCAAIKHQILNLIDFNFTSLPRSFEYSVSSTVILLTALCLCLQLDAFVLNNQLFAKRQRYLWISNIVILVCLAYMFNIVLQLQASLETTIAPAPFLLVLHSVKHRL